MMDFAIWVVEPRWDAARTRHHYDVRGKAQGGYAHVEDPTSGLYLFTDKALAAAFADRMNREAGWPEEGEG